MNSRETVHAMTEVMEFPDMLCGRNFRQNFDTYLVVETFLQKESWTLDPSGKVISARTGNDRCEECLRVLDSLLEESLVGEIDGE